MKKLMALLVGVGLMAGVAQADLLVFYNFSDEEVEPTTVASGVTAGDFEISDGNITYGSSQSDDWSSDLPYAQGSGGYDGDSFGDSKFFSFTITPTDPTQYIEITGFSFEHRRTSAGPQTVGYSIDGVLQESGSLGDGITLTWSYPFSEPEIGFTSDPGETVTIGIHGWDGGGGQYRINDVTLEGSVIPEPGTVALLAMGLLGVFAARRKLRG